MTARGRHCWGVWAFILSPVIEPFATTVGSTVILRPVYFRYFVTRVEEGKKMPKKKSGQRKKAEKQRERQKDIRTAYQERPLADRPCNFLMVHF